MSIEHQDEYRIWGMNNRGHRTPTIKGFTHDWNDVRNKYIEENPLVVYIWFEIAIPDKEAIAAGTTNAQMAERPRG